MIQKILIVIGTRPNFIKVTQFKSLAKDYPELDLRIVHTGQHYDEKMANVFFDQFELRPDYFLNISPDTPVKQMANIMAKLEDLIDQTFKPDVMIVPGDVNSTLAAALVANKKGIKLAHLESGLRSQDRAMPEEWNRILVDEMADYYFVTEKSGIEFLEKEKKKGKVFFVGNTMIDTMVAFDKKIEASKILDQLKIDSDFILLTLHRPSNVDSKEGIKTMLELLSYLDNKIKIVFPIHPRTKSSIENFGFKNAFDELQNIILTDPLSYFDFQKLIATSKMVLTDSGGIQEETTFRGVPCLTLRDNTERPSTLNEGTNTLVPFEFEVLQKYIDQILDGTYKKGKVPELWDGKATNRILKHIAEL